MSVRYVVIFTLPSGGKYAASKYQEKGKKRPTFALVPCDPDTGTVRNAISFDSDADAQEWIDKTREHPKGEQIFSQLTWEILPMMEPH